MFGFVGQDAFQIVKCPSKFVLRFFLSKCFACSFGSSNTLVWRLIYLGFDSILRLDFVYFS